VGRGQGSQWASSVRELRIDQRAICVAVKAAN